MTWSDMHLRLSHQTARGESADYVWRMADIDPMATACAAVNAMVWNLGREVYIFCGDSLLHGDTFELAAKHRAEATQAWHEAVSGSLSVVKLLSVVKEYKELLRAHDRG